ncbi:AAA family ATPase [Georgenia sp. 10Sc9-8]|uniref:AAA family ATPase n=1 Tax=Georgenia halotolerans TaxID=3028317 RepID=A0ABT5U117_9MICO|nr:AAA family ATPase [Georgenia halotolerans]
MELPGSSPGSTYFSPPEGGDTLRLVLVGRRTERAAIAELVDSARSGRGGALVVRGLPGTGKSVLLADAAGTAEATVLRTQGIESESPLAFAALHRLLRPLMGHAGSLPAPQARALRAAFGEVEGDGDRFLVFLAALSLLAEAAARRPVLVVVDDAHWLDEASAAALLFVARRVQDEPVAVLLAARDGDVRTFDSVGLPELRLTGLGEAGAAALLEHRSGVTVPDHVRDRLVAGTDGNPLGLVELAGALSPAQLSGVEALPARLPLTAGVEAAFLDRYERLGPHARLLLLVVAADDSARVATIRRAARSLGVGDEALAEAEASGLVRVADGAVELRHPLVRSAVYGAAPSAARRDVHAALTEALTGDADRRAWHRAAASDGPDDAVVAELDAAADRSRRRGGLEAAAAAWQRAAELTEDPAERAGRLYQAARAAWLAGQGSRARQLAETAQQEATDPGLRADAARLRARVEWNVGSLPVAHRMIMTAAQEVAPHDPDRAREMAMFGVAVASFGGDSGAGIDPVPFAALDAASTTRTRCFAELLLGLDRAGRGDWSRATPLLRSAIARTAVLEEEDQDLLPNLGIAALHLGDDAAARRHHELILTRARSTGALLMVLYSLTRLALTDLTTGQWRAAEAAATEAVELAGTTGQPGLGAMPSALLALLAALRGEGDVAARVHRAEQVAAAHPTGILAGLVADMLRWAKAAAPGTRPDAALAHLEGISLGLVRRTASLDRIEAAVRAGRLDLAAAWTQEINDFADATHQPWAAAAAAHGRALLGPGEEAVRHFGEALGHHSPRTFDRARTELAYGQQLRRVRRRVDARTHLGAALEVFEELGASPWAERAAVELRATGQSVRRREASTAAVGLTPQERQVARLVGQGLSNREVAAQLFLSPRTVDFHLRNIFAKRGLTSRAELVRIELAESAGTAPA